MPLRFERWLRVLPPAIFPTRLTKVLPGQRRVYVILEFGPRMRLSEYWSKKSLTVIRRSLSTKRLCCCNIGVIANKLAVGT